MKLLFSIFNTPVVYNNTLNLVKRTKIELLYFKISYILSADTESEDEFMVYEYINVK